MIENAPFDIRRVFYLHDCQGLRGGHAHKNMTEYLVAVNGTFKVHLDDGALTMTYTVDKDCGVLVPPMVWVELSDFSQGAVVLALSSHTHEDTEYIRDYAEFQRTVL